MTRSGFDQVIKAFVKCGLPENEEVVRVNFGLEFSIGDSAEGIKFGGECLLNGGRYVPIDLHKIGKAKCRELRHSIKVFYREYLLSLAEKSNVVEIVFLPPSNEMVYTFR